MDDAAGRDPELTGPVAPGTAKDAVLKLFDAIATDRLDLIDGLVSDHWVAMWVRNSGRHTGDSLGHPPTGRTGPVGGTDRDLQGGGRCRVGGGPHNPRGVPGAENPVVLL